MDLIKALWRGDVPLWKTYWLFAVLGGFFFNLAFVYIQYTSITFYATPGAEVVLWVLIGAAFAYSAVIFIAIWRSAKKYKGPRTNAVLARIAVVIGWLSIFGAIGEFLSPNITENSLREEARMLNAQLPAMLDEVTRLDRVTVDGLSITYQSTYLGSAASELNSEIFRSEVVASLIAGDCDAFRDYLEANVLVNREYRDSDGNLIAEIYLRRINCLGIWSLPRSAGREIASTAIAALAREAFVTINASATDRPVSSGSGFVIRNDGVIVTNLHIVQGATSVQIELSDGESIEDVAVLGADELRDILVLQISAEGLDALPLGDDFLVEVGQEVFVLGNPLGFNQTFSDGLVSAIRNDGAYDFFQISAPISAGSSGGPVLNDRGEVIAIASATVEEAQNLNLAVPIRYVYEILTNTAAPLPFAEFMTTADFTNVLSTATGDRRAESAALLEQASAETAEQLSDYPSWEQQVFIRLLRNESAFADAGMSSYGDPLGLEILKQGQQQRLSIFLDAGEYVAAGVCDDDCTDLDLAVYGVNSNLLDFDEQIDPEPKLNFSVDTPGEYVFVVNMYECATDTCYYGIQVFSMN